MRVGVPTASTRWWPVSDLPELPGEYTWRYNHRKNVFISND